MRIKKRRLAAIIAVYLLVSMLVTSAFSAEPFKDETVYVNLDYDGSVINTNVVNAFKIPASGVISDYGDYKSIKNLTDTGVPIIKNDYIEWRTNPSDGIFYYQGELSNKELPWIFSIEYRLNGFPIDAAALSGAEGRLEITIGATSNEGADPYFKDHYMAQISAALDTEHCRNISAPDATIVTVGSTKNAAFTVMPSSSEIFSITMDITDFEMNGLSINMMKFSNSITESMEGMEGGIQEMTSGIGQLVSGTNQLKMGTRDLADGIRILNTGMADITLTTPAVSAGLAEFGDGLYALNSGVSQIAGASNQIREGLGALDENSYEIINGYSAIEDGLSEMTEQKPELENGLEELEKNEPDLSELTEGTEQFADGLDQLMSVSYDHANATAALLQRVMMSPDPEVQALIMDIAIINGQAAGIKDGLAMTRAGFEDMSDGMDEVVSGMDTLYDTALTFGNATLGLMDGAQEMHVGLKALNEGLGEYTQGISELAGNYATFDRSLWDIQEGFSSLSSGFDPLHSGLDGMFSALGSVKEGLDMLDQNVSLLPDSIQQLEDGQRQMGDSMGIAIGEITNQFSFGGSDDMKPVSFVSPLKGSPNSVQFVIRTPDIKKAEKVIEEDVKEEPQSFWGKLKSLF